MHPSCPSVSLCILMVTSPCSRCLLANHSHARTKMGSSSSSSILCPNCRFLRFASWTWFCRKVAVLRCPECLRCITNSKNGPLQQLRQETINQQPTTPSTSSISSADQFDCVDRTPDARDSAPDKSDTRTTETYPCHSLSHKPQSKTTAATGPSTGPSRSRPFPRRPSLLRLLATQLLTLLAFFSSVFSSSSNLA